MEDLNNLSYTTVTAAASIYLGNCAINSTHYTSVKNSFLKSFHDDSKKDTFLEKYQKCVANQERIDLFRPYFNWTSVPAEFLQGRMGWEKSAALSSALRLQGDEESDHTHSLRAYNLALSFAPPNSVQEALSYSARSSLFQRLSEFKLAQRDAHLAKCSPSFPDLDDATRQQIEEREKNCANKISGESITENSTPGKVLCNDMVAIIRGKPNDDNLLPGAISGVELKVDPIVGRKLVATQDFPAGSPLLYDEPYVILPENILGWNTSRCSTCVQPILGGIPDPLSPFATFCSADCLSKSATLPAAILSYIQACPSLHHALLPLSVLYKVSRTQTPAQSSAHLDFSGSHHTSVFNLIQHKLLPWKFDSKSVPPEFTALFVSQLAAELTTNLISPLFYPDPALLLHLLESLPYNVVTLSTPPTSPVGGGPYATGVFTRIALANSSCHPNALLYKNSRSPVGLLVSCRRISKGEEILLCYKSHWSRESVHDRRAWLRDHYKFDCACAACQQGWEEKDMKSELVFQGDLLQKAAHFEEDFEQVIAIVEEGEWREGFDAAVRCCDQSSHFDPTWDMVVAMEEILRRIVIQLQET